LIIVASATDSHHIIIFQKKFLKPITIPPYLKKGDTIGIVCPAGFMPAKKLATAIGVIENYWGYRVRLGATVGHQYHYFSGTDEERLDDLQSMMDDPDVKAILCGRGGYGTGRIIERLDFSKFRKHPKWIIGFSDITILHAHLFSRYRIASLHAPMANAFNDDGYKNEYVQSLRAALQGKKGRYPASCHPFNHPGKATGLLVGGNLALVAHLVGTSSDFDTRGKILFLEDVGEYLYNIDRMMYQLKRSGKLDHLAGLVFGKFSDVKDTETPFGKTADEILHDIVKEYRFPICYDFPVSHETENFALKTGVEYELAVTRNKVMLKEKG
jgi:muramoyltetrapeptide carboxypeptidase